MTDASPIIRFDRFALDRANRQLLRDGQPVEVGSRYLDALVLLLEARGDLVSKDRFMDEVWRGVPVTDEALTQCIRTLRRALDDDASAPRFIRTVPKHGYRFVGTLHDQDSAPEAPAALVTPSTGRLAGAATLGGGLAGLFGGLFYGLLLARGSAEGSPVLLTVTALCLAVGVLGGAGVGLGMATACALRGRSATMLMLGGTLGGLLVGALGRLVGLDLFHVLAGVGVGPVTGLFEGAVVGLLTGAGCALAARFAGWRGGVFALLTGAAGGALVALAGGRLMAGSLLLLDQSLEQSRLDLDVLGGMFGDPQFGTAALVAASALEAGLFVAFVSLAVQRQRAFRLT